MSGVKFNLLNVEFVVPAGNNRVAYDISELVSILEYEDGNIFGHTQRIGSVLKTLPYRTA